MTSESGGPSSIFKRMLRVHLSFFYRNNDNASPTSPYLLRAFTSCLQSKNPNMPEYSPTSPCHSPTYDIEDWDGCYDQHLATYGPPLSPPATPQEEETVLVTKEFSFNSKKSFSFNSRNQFLRQERARTKGEGSRWIGGSHYTWMR